MNISGTQTGRFAMRKDSNIVDLPKGASYMVTTNRAQMVAALKAVSHEGTTVIDAINAQGKRLVRYTFHGARRMFNGRLSPSEQFDKHLRKLAGQVRKTPVEAWR